MEGSGTIVNELDKNIPHLFGRQIIIKIKVLHTPTDALIY
jgi:hypothetical protein